MAAGGLAVAAVVGAGRTEAVAVAGNGGRRAAAAAVGICTRA